MLQWGRDQLIAEVMVVTRVWSTGYMLQWGRDQLIAEVYTAGWQSAGCPRFNGAAIN